MGRARVLYVVNEFPTLSQTYIRSEIEAVRERHDVSVIHLRPAPVTYKTDVNHRRMRRHRSIVRAIRSARPSVLHSHYVMLAPMMHRLSVATGVPFTVRSHSYDVFGYLRDRRADPGDGVTVADVVEALNSPQCLGVLAFPFMREFFVDSGVRNEQVHDCYPVVRYDRFHDRSPNGNAIMNTGAARPKKKMEDCIALAGQLPGRRFDLYAMGTREVKELRKLNESFGAPVTFMPPVDPDEMPAEYKRHRWLVYTASFEKNTVGWPMSIAEAQAAGVGVCVPNLRPDLQEFVGEGGHLYDDIRDVPELISEPPTQTMRAAGFELARRSDIQSHITTLTDLW